MFMLVKKCNTTNSQLKKEALTSKFAYKTANRRPRKYTKKMDERINVKISYCTLRHSLLQPLDIVGLAYIRLQINKFL